MEGDKSSDSNRSSARSRSSLNAGFMGLSTRQEERSTLDSRNEFRPSVAGYLQSETVVCH